MRYDDFGSTMTQHLRRAALSILCMLMLTIIVAIYSGSSAREQQMKTEMMRRLYSSTGRIVAIDEASDTMTIRSGGDVYWTYQGVNDFHLKDPVSFLVDDGGTFGIHADDKILKLHYAGGL